MTSRTITWLFIDDQERRAREAIQRKLTLTHGSGAAIATSSYSAGPQVPRYSGARQFLGPLRQAFHDGESFVPHHIHLVQGGCGGPGRHAEGLQGRRGAESEVEQAAWETETKREQASLETARKRARDAIDLHAKSAASMRASARAEIGVLPPALARQQPY